MKPLIIILSVLVSAHVWAAVHPGTGKPQANPVLRRAAARAHTQRSPVITNRMARPIRVASQSILNGQIVSRMTDGSTVVAPLRTATTARVPNAIARLRVDRALNRIANASGPARDLPSRAEALEAMATQAEEPARGTPQDIPDRDGNGKAAAAAAAGAAAGAAAAYGVTKKQQRKTP